MCLADKNSHICVQNITNRELSQAKYLLFSSITILWANPCGSGYSHSLFVKKKDKGAQTNAPIPFAKQHHSVRYEK